jgi:hypothetical protein
MGMTYNMDTMQEIEKESMHDFKHLMEQIDFSAYSPYSKDFMTALFVGQMWDLIRHLNKCMAAAGTESHAEDDATGHKGSAKKYADIEEELEGAKKYIKMSEDTGDAQYKSMASDELRHADILLKKALSKNPVPEELKMLHEMEEKCTAIKMKI